MSELSKAQLKIVGDEYERLRKIHGHVNDDVFIEAARDPKSPLHKLYDWDKDRVFTLYLRERTQYLLRHVGLVVSTKDKEAVTIRSIVRTKAGEYIPIREIKPESTDAAWLRSQCINDLKSARRRLMALDEILKGKQPKISRAAKTIDRVRATVESVAA